MTAAFGKFFLPGPTDVHPDVLAAQLHPMIGHRSGAMEQLLQKMAPQLQALARTSRTVLIGTTSATGFMEMAVRNGIRRRAVSIVNGAFSQRFAELVTAALLLVPSTAAVGGALAIAVMSGAILSHLTVLGIEVRGDGGLLFALAVLVWAAAAGVVWIYRAQLPIVGATLAASGGRP